MANALMAAGIQVPPGRNTLTDAVEAGGESDVFILENNALYEISRSIRLRGNQKITTKRPCQSFQDQAMIQSFGGPVMDVLIRAQNHFYDFRGDNSDPKGRWYWLPVGLAATAQDPESENYAGPHAGVDGTEITLTGMSSDALEGELYLNAWDDDADPDDFERVNVHLSTGIQANGNNVVEGVEMRGFRVPFETAKTATKLTMYRCKWLPAKTGVDIKGGELRMNTCWGSGGSQRVHTWNDIKNDYLRDIDNQGKRQLLAGSTDAGDVIVENCAFYDFFDGILGPYPTTLEVKNCLWDCPRIDDALQLNPDPPHGDVWVYRNIIIGTGPSWHWDPKGSGTYLVEECFINPGRDVYEQGSVRDRSPLSSHGDEDHDPHHFHRCTFFNVSNRAGSKYIDRTYGSSGIGTEPHEWHDCLTYRFTREDKPSAKPGQSFDKGTVDIQRTVFIDCNEHNDIDDSFVDGGSFEKWKGRNDPEALYIRQYGLSEADVMNDPGIGARIAGRDAGAIPQDAKTIWGELGPDWLTPDSDERLPVVSVATMEQEAAKTNPGTNSFKITRDVTKGDLSVEYVIKGYVDERGLSIPLSGAVNLPDGTSSVVLKVTREKGHHFDENKSILIGLTEQADYRVARGHSSFAKATAYPRSQE